MIPSRKLAKIEELMHPSFGLEAEWRALWLAWPQSCAGAKSGRGFPVTGLCGLTLCDGSDFGSRNMRFGILLLLLAALIWLWRRSNSGDTRQPPVTPRATDTTPRSDTQVMVACALCRVHIPSAEAVEGRHGQYCCAAHREQAEA